MDVRTVVRVFCVACCIGLLPAAVPQHAVIGPNYTVWKTVECGEKAGSWQLPVQLSTSDHHLGSDILGWSGEPAGEEYIWKKTFNLTVSVAGLTRSEGHTGNGGGRNRARAGVWVEEEEIDGTFRYYVAFDYDSNDVRQSDPCDPDLEQEG